MKVNILATGSKCNCVLATFADYERIIFDFGNSAGRFDTGAMFLCNQRDFRGFPTLDFDYYVDVNGKRIKKRIDDVLITHAHKDHSGDWDKIKGFDFPKTLSVKEFPVIHDVENRGFVVMNDKTREGVIYATDYSEIPQNSFDFLLKLVGFKEWKWFACLELSYCDFLYKKLPDIQRFGLNRHCSDVRFFDYAKKILEVNDKVNIVTLHASARQSEYIEGAYKSGEVCPPDWCREQFYKRFAGASVRFGEASGMWGTYNYIERV